MGAVAVIVAAGSGSRFGGSTPKQFLPLHGKPLLAHAIEPFLRSPAISRLVVVLPEAGFADSCRIIEPHADPGGTELVPGGKTRQESVCRGLERVPGDGLVAVHDGARPLVSAQLIERVVAAAAEHGGAIAAVPVVETLKEVTEEGLVRRTVDRALYYRAQTPQCFPFEVLRRALDRAIAQEYVGTDEAALVERLGLPVKIVEGSESNVKVTTADDFARVASYLERS